MDYIYGTLCDKVKRNIYTGGSTDTAEVFVNNSEGVITVDAKFNPEYVKEEVTRQIQDLDLNYDDQKEVHQFVTHVNEYNGKIDVHKDVIRIDDVETLQAVLNNKQATLYFEGVPSSTNKVTTKEYVDAAIATKSAATYVGITQTTITEGSTVNPIILADGSSHEVQKGDIAAFPSVTTKWVWLNNAWTLFENLTVYALASDLQTATNYFEGRVDALDQAVEDETSARISSYQALNAAIEAETAAREARDTTLSTSISNEVNRAISAENNLNSKIDNGFAVEAQVRENADTALQNAIDSEANQRATADNSLQTNINSEAQTRSAEDTTLRIRILNEEVNRAAGDANLQANIDLEAQARSTKDIDLQNQIDAITSGTDVVDVVSVYDRTNYDPQPLTDIVHYDTSKLKDQNIVKVLLDETHNDATSYYRWFVNPEGHWSYIGSLGPFYTKAETDSRLAEEAQTRAARDQQLQDDLSAEINRSTTTDTELQNSLNQEAIDRSTADTTLTNNLQAHVSDTTNPHNVTKAQVGLGNADNTSDLDKPISTATEQALDNKVGFTDYATADKAGAIKTGNGFSVDSSGVVKAENRSKEQYETSSSNVFLSKGTLENIKEDLVERAGAAMDADLALVAKSGSYNDLDNKPTIGETNLIIKKNGTEIARFSANQTGQDIEANILADVQVQADWAETDETASSFIQNKPELAEVALSGSYNDLSDTPTIGASNLIIQKNGSEVARFSANQTGSDIVANIQADQQVQADWGQTDNTQPDFIKNKPDLADVATSGDYEDLNNKPTIGESNLIVQKNGVEIARFSANQNGEDIVANIQADQQVNADWEATSGPAEILHKPYIPTKTSDLEKDDVYVKEEVRELNSNAIASAMGYTDKRIDESKLVWEEF